MYRRFFSLVGLVFLLAHDCVLADNHAPNLQEQSAPIVAGTATTRLLLPTYDVLRVGEPLAPLTAYTFLRHSGRQPLSLPPFVRDLVGPWLPRLTSRDPLLTSSTNATRPPMHPPWPIKQNTPLPRLDHSWRVVPIDTLSQAHNRLAVDGNMDLGLEVRAGSTKKDRATNAIKGMASSRVTLLPARFLEHGFGRSLSVIGTSSDNEHSTHGQWHLGLTTTGAYVLNPSTRVITPTGEVVGTLSWMTTKRDRFTQDPWRIVAFRWHPTVSWEGRTLIGEGKKQAEATRMPLDTFTGTLHGDLRLDFLSPQLAASGNYQYRQGLTDTQTKWEQASVSLKYQLNHHISVGGSFTRGKTAPSQPSERGLALEMGVMF